MYNFGGRFYIDLAQVYLIEPFENNSPEYPYGLRVKFLSDIERSLVYNSKFSRNNELNDMISAKQQLELKGYQATMDEIRYTVKKEMRLARDDIRVLRNLLLKMYKGGTYNEDSTEA